jgi:hypothetical protein
MLLQLERCRWSLSATAGAAVLMASIGWQNTVPACGDGQDNDGDGQADEGCTPPVPGNP